MADPKPPMDVQIQDALDGIADTLGSFEDPIMVPLLLAHAVAACIRWARDQETPEAWTDMGGVDGFLESFDLHVKDAIGGAENQELAAILRTMTASGAKLN